MKKNNKEVLIKSDYVNDVSSDEKSYPFLNSIIENEKIVHVSMPLIGGISNIDEEGGVWVCLPDINQEICIDSSLVTINSDDIGKNVLVIFGAGNVINPVIVGVIQNKEMNNKKTVIKNSNGILFESGDAKIEIGNDNDVVIKGDNIDSYAYVSRPVWL